MGKNLKVRYCCIQYFICFWACFGLGSCNFYRQDIMFAADTVLADEVFRAISRAENNYIIRPYDRFEVQLFANDAEIMIDPAQTLAAQLNNGTNNMNGNIGQQNNMFVRPIYNVLANGYSVLPLVGAVYLSGHTMAQADSMLAAKYDNFYVKPFVITRIINRRCVVFSGAMARIVLLENENTNLIEVLAMAGGLAPYSQAGNIRLIRGNLNKPQVQIINLTTISGMQKAQLQIQPNDIIYVEPGRRAGIELIRDSAVIFGLASSVLTLVFLLTRF